jgi:hypothetical protein
LEEAKSMGGTTLAPTHSTWPTLPLSPRFEPRARALAWPYALGGPLSRSRWRHSRLFLFYSSLIDFYIPYTFIVTMRTVEADKKRMEEMFAYVQSLGMSLGHPMPPRLFQTPQPPTTTPVSLPYLFIALLHIQCLY